MVGSWHMLNWYCLTSNIESIINHLSSSLIDELSIEVRRSHLLKDAIKENKKKKFDPMKCLSVCHLFNFTIALCSYLANVF